MITKTCRDFKELTGGDGTTLDKPKYLIEDAFSLGPVDIKLDEAGKTVMTSSIDNSLKAFSLPDEQGQQPTLLCQAPGQEAQAWKFDFDNASNQIITGQISLHSLELKTGGSEMTKEAQNIADGQKFIHSIACSKSRSLAATGNIDGIVSLYDLKERKFKARFSNHNLAVRALEFDNSSTSMVSAGEDLHIFVSDVETQQRLQTLVGHGDWVTSIATHPVKRDLFLTTSLDHTIKIWSTQTHKKISEIDLGSPVWGAAYSPSGDYFAVATENGTVSLLNCKQLSSTTSAVI